MDSNGTHYLKWVKQIERATGYRLVGEALMEVLVTLHELHEEARTHTAGPETPGDTSEVTENPEETTENTNPTTEIRDWWEQTAHNEITQLTNKMAEYGGLSRATDLTEIGRDLVAAGISKGPLTGNGKVQDGWLQELGIYFYVRGKFARWQAAVIEGRPVSDDTLLDIGVYVRMAQRVRAVGGWPV